MSRKGSAGDDIFLSLQRKSNLNTKDWGKKVVKTFCEEGCTCQRHIYRGPMVLWTKRQSDEAYEIPYTDDGCEVSPKCVDCPLVECRYVDPKPFKEWQRTGSVAIQVKKSKEDQVYEILDLQAAGFTSEEICEKLEINKVRDLRWKVISAGYQWEGMHPFDVKRLKMNEGQK